MTTSSNYECMFILDQNLSKEDTEKAIEKFHHLLTGMGSEISKVERLGKRKLAYEVKGQQEGFYCLLQFKAAGQAVHELERQFRLSDAVVKFLIFRVEPPRVLKVKKPKPKAVPETAAA